MNNTAKNTLYDYFLLPRNDRGIRPEDQITKNHDERFLRIECKAKRFLHVSCV